MNVLIRQSALPRSMQRTIVALAVAILGLTALTSFVRAAPDSQGSEYWLTFPSNLSPGELSLFIAGEAATTGTVAIPGLAFSQPFAVTPGTVTTVTLPSSAQLNAPDGIEDLGIHVTSVAEVTVYGLNRVQFTTDAYLGLPVDILGTEYIVLAWKNVEVVNNSQLAVVGTQDATTVTVNPSVTTGSHTAGVPYSLTLNQGQTYQLQAAASGADLSGTIVTSDKPVAVFGGHQCANVPNGSTYACDHVVEQIPPSATWGESFVTVPLATRSGGDTFRVIASENGTNVAINGATVATLNRGQVHEQIIAGASVISADAPILVAQYSNGSTFDGVTSDPFMMLVPPFEQFLASYTVTTPATGFSSNFINLAVPDAAVGSVQLDGTVVPSSSFTPIGTSGFSAAQLPVELGSHTLDGPLPFGVLVYGFASFDSYGYPGGLSLAPIARVASVVLAPKTATNPVGTEHCVAATVRDQNDGALEGVRVDFTVSGVNPTTGFATTNASGVAVFCYIGSNPGNDTITGSVGSLSDTAAKTWTTSTPPTDTAASGTKYYDANANGQFDAGEAGLADWPIDYDDGTAAASVLTDADGSFSVMVDPGTYTFAERQAAAPWFQTGNTVDQSGGTGSVVLNADMTYSVTLDSGETATGLSFGNLCVGSGGARSKGFWTNKNGQALIDEDDLAMLRGLNLVKEDGTPFDPTTRQQLKAWLQDAQSVNMAYMLSAQLAAMALNVHNGMVMGSALIYAPDAISANAAGFATVSAVIVEANAELGLHPVALADAAWRGYQEGLVEALDGANNNLTFVQADASTCPSPFVEASFDLYADGSVSCGGADDISRAAGSVTFVESSGQVLFSVSLDGAAPNATYTLAISEEPTCANAAFFPDAITTDATGDGSFSGSLAKPAGTYNLLVNLVTSPVPSDPTNREIATVDTTVVVH